MADGDTANRRLISADTDSLKNIELLLLDVDGVLTDGRLYYDDNGLEIKAFNVRDGLGLRLLMNGGVDIGIITGRRSQALVHRCRDLGIHRVYDGVSDKADLLDSLCEQMAIPAASVAFMGDDLPDIPIMRKVGLSIAVADAHNAVLAMADRVTAAGGGQGAVREVCEAVLKSRGLWKKICRGLIGDTHEE